MNSNSEDNAQQSCNTNIPSINEMTDREPLNPNFFESKEKQSRSLAESTNDNLEMIISKKKLKDLPPISPPRKVTIQTPSKLIHTKSVKQIFPISNQGAIMPLKRNTEKIDSKKRSGSIFFRRKEVKEPKMDEKILPKLFENKRMSANIFSVLTKVKGAISTLKGRAGIGKVRTLRPNQIQIFNDWTCYPDNSDESQDEEEQSRVK